MPIPTNNNGSTYYNRNDCRSFNQPVTTALVALSAYTCSEVILVNKTGVTVYLYDSSYFDDSNRMAIDNNETFVIRGLTNSSQVSAKTASSGGLLYFRTQYYSFLPQV
jgi:hypothetical protein